MMTVALRSYFLDVFNAVALAKAKTLSHYLSYGDRNEGMAAAYQTGDYSMKEIALTFGVHYATVSRAVKLVV